MKRNTYFFQLSQDYFFKRISTYLRDFKLNNPEISVINLGVGDTTNPITSFVVDSICVSVRNQGKSDTYRGYGPEEGFKALRERIASRVYGDLIRSNDIFISDGAKCDIGRLQLLFGPGRTVVLQDPVYPAYLDISTIGGANSIVKVPCRKENQFVPDLSILNAGEYIIYLCYPNNPIGNVLNHNELRKIVDFAAETRSFIVFDAVYSQFISSSELPKSIYEIKGAEEVAIEINSFSKMAGFTGLRLGWSVVPQELKYLTGESVREDWIRLLGAGFNGASLLSQEGGIAYFDQSSDLRAAGVRFYKENACILKEAFERAGYSVFGGVHSPYLWVECQQDTDVFDFFLKEYGIAVAPGYGFGNEGRGFFRLSPFGSREDMEIVCTRLKCSCSVTKHIF